METRGLDIRKMIMCPEAVQYVSISRCITCRWWDRTFRSKVYCKFLERESIRVKLRRERLEAERGF